MLFLKYDIIMLCETWANDDAEFFLNGYEYYNYPRKYKHRCAKRSSGGLGVFIRKNVREGVVIGGHTNDIIAWFVLKKSYFGFPRDIHLACIYIVPESSSNSTQEEFNIICWSNIGDTRRKWGFIVRGL